MSLVCIGFIWCYCTDRLETRGVFAWFLTQKPEFYDENPIAQAITLLRIVEWDFRTLLYTLSIGCV